MSYSQQLAAINDARKKYSNLVQLRLRETNAERRVDLDFRRLQTYSLIQEYQAILDQQRYDSAGDASGFESGSESASDDETKTGGGTTFTGGHPGIFTKQADELRKMSLDRWNRTPISTPEEQARVIARRKKKGYARQFTPSLKRQTSLNIEGDDAFKGGMMKSSNNNNNNRIRANWGQGNTPQLIIFNTWNDFLTYLTNKKKYGKEKEYDYVIEKTYIYYKKGHRDEGVYNKPYPFRQYVKFKNIITNDQNWKGPVFSVVHVEKIRPLSDEAWQPQQEDINKRDIHMAQYQVVEEDIVIKENEGQANERGVGHLPWKIGENPDNWFIFNHDGNQNFDNYSRPQRLPQDNSEVSRMTEIIQNDNQHDQPPQQAQQGGKKSKIVKEMIKVFQKHPDVFPSGYFRFLGARLENHLKKKTIIFKDGVILTWIKYQKTVKKSEECIYKPGDVKLDQIVNKNPGNGKAKKIMLKFLKDNKDSTVWLEVKKDNIRARDFYEKNGFQEVCSTKFGDIKGIIMKKDP